MNFSINIRPTYNVVENNNILWHFTTKTFLPIASTIVLFSGVKSVCSAIKVRAMRQNTIELTLAQALF